MPIEAKSEWPATAVETIGLVDDMVDQQSLIMFIVQTGDSGIGVIGLLTRRAFCLLPRLAFGLLVGGRGCAGRLRHSCS